jgi:hypothetical protein
MFVTLAPPIAGKETSTLERYFLDIRGAEAETRSRRGISRDLEELGGLVHPIRFARRRPKLAVLLVVVLALALAGGAFALWTLTQSTNKFQGQTASTITLTFNTPTAGDLAAATQCVPGGSCALTAEVSNPSTAPIQLTSYQPSTASSFDDSGSTCPLSASNGLTGPAEGTASVPISPAITVPAGATNQVISLPGALALAAGAGPGCQGKNIVQTSGSVTVTFTAGS